MALKKWQKILLQKIRCQERASTALEMSFIYVLLLAMIMSIVHFGFLYHTSLALTDAADVGLSVFKGTQNLEETKMAINELIGEDALVKNLKVSAEVIDDGAVVYVSANSPKILAGFSTNIQKQASGPLEKFELLELGVVENG